MGPPTRRPPTRRPPMGIRHGAAPRGGFARAGEERGDVRWPPANAPRDRSSGGRVIPGERHFGRDHFTPQHSFSDAPNRCCPRRPFRRRSLLLPAVLGRGVLSRRRDGKRGKGLRAPLEPALRRGGGVPKRGRGGGGSASPRDSDRDDRRGWSGCRALVPKAHRDSNAS